MNKYLKRCLSAFLYSSVISMICLLLIEAIAYAAGHPINPISPDFVALFPSSTIAFGVDILIYGLIGVVFSAMTFIYDVNRIGILWQNVIYFIGTTVFWLPLILFIWQLYRYPLALIYTVLGFLLSEVIVTIVGMKQAKKDVELINQALS